MEILFMFLVGLIVLIVAIIAIVNGVVHRSNQLKKDQVDRLEKRIEELERNKK